MSSEEKKVAIKPVNTCSVSVEIRNGDCKNICNDDLNGAVLNNNVKEAFDDEKTESNSSEGVKATRKVLPNLPSVSKQSSTNLTIKEDRSSFSEEDSSDNLESLDSGSRDGGSTILQNLTQRPKSVSFHTASSLPAERKITSANDCIQYMLKGSSLLKVRPSARQFRRNFYLEEDLSALRWSPTNKKPDKAKLCIKAIKEVRMGRTTDVLRSKEISWTYSEDSAFSIIYSDNFESLDLIADSPDEANIWVTGLNMLIGATKSPDAFDERQKMREKFLRDKFDEADTDKKGHMSQAEIIALLQKIYSNLNPSLVHQKIMEFAHFKQGEERGRIDSDDFVNIFQAISTRSEIYNLLYRFSCKDYMTVDDLHLFLEGEQGMTNISTEDCLKIIEQYELSEEAKRNNQIILDGFTLFLLSDSCDIFDPSRKIVYQEMTHPLPHYFITTSNNTYLYFTRYLAEDQLKGPSRVEAYSNALKMGCRCIKVDCWDGDDEIGPVAVFHGNTLTTKLALKDVFETIQEFAFVASPYPLIIHLENHCSLENQQYVSSLATEIFGNQLYIPSRDGYLTLLEMSPESLKHKIIIKGKKLSPKCTEAIGEVSDEDQDKDCSDSKNLLRKIKLCRTLSNLVSLTRTRFWDIELSYDIQRLSDVSSFSEAMAQKLSEISPDIMIKYNKSCLTHIFPDSKRVNSHNFDSLPYWCFGCQLVALNYQTNSSEMDLYQGWFRQNGNCGYVLKPFFLRDQLCLYSPCSKEPLPGIEPTFLHIKVISAQQLPQPNRTSAKASAIDPYVALNIYGVPVDRASCRTKTVSNEGHSPQFDEAFEFTVTVPELALLRIAVLDDDFIEEEFIGQYTIPFTCLCTGYRHLRLFSSSNDPLYNSTLFVHISMTTRSEQKLKKRKASMFLNMKTVGIKQADDVFKNAANPLDEAYKMRMDEEQAMLDLCKECGLQDSANIVQCLRILSLRLANCPSVTNWEIVNINNQPMIKIYGELTQPLSKLVSFFEKVLVEYNYIKRTANETRKILTELYRTGEAAWEETMHNASNVGARGRKSEKAAESFLWNMTLLRTQTNLLTSTYKETCTALQQINNLMPVFSKLFQRERDSLIATSDTNTAVTPVLLNQFNLTPYTEQLPVTPTSPGDGRLRGILKKTNTPSAAQSSGSDNTGSTVFFPGQLSENANR